MDCVGSKSSHNRRQRPSINLTLCSDNRCIDSDVFKVDNLDVVIGHPEFKLKVKNDCTTVSRLGDYALKFVSCVCCLQSLRNLAIFGKLGFETEKSTYKTDRQVIFKRRPAEVFVN